MSSTRKGSSHVKFIMYRLALGSENNLEHIYLSLFLPFTNGLSFQQLSCVGSIVKSFENSKLLTANSPWEDTVINILLINLIIIFCYIIEEKETMEQSEMISRERKDNLTIINLYCVLLDCTHSEWHSSAVADFQFTYTTKGVTLFCNKYVIQIRGWFKIKWD